MVDHDEESRAQLRAMRKKERLRVQNRRKIINVLLDHTDGREFLWELLTIGKQSIQPFAMNALAMAFNCGELNVGKQILDLIIDASPAGYVRMMQERTNGRTDPYTGPDSEPDPSA